MSDTTDFPLPADVTAEERETARRELAKHARIVGEDDRAIRIEGRTVGKTGPIWHLQYTRIFAVEKGYVVAAHDLRDGIVVRHAERAEDLGTGFEDERVRELIEDELRFRGVIAREGGAGERAPA